MANPGASGVLGPTAGSYRAVVARQPTTSAKAARRRRGARRGRGRKAIQRDQEAARSVASLSAAARTEGSSGDPKSHRIALSGSARAAGTKGRREFGARLPRVGQESPRWRRWA